LPFDFFLSLPRVHLGIAYYAGRGVHASIPNAKKFFKQANIDGDHPAADKMLTKLGLS
jgi:TPR repeat protein